MSAILSNVFYVSIFATVFLSLVSDQIQDLNGVDLSRSVDPDNPTTADPVEVRKTDGWGLPDVTVPYGSLFQYTLPKQDEFGLFLNYKVV